MITNNCTYFMTNDTYTPDWMKSERYTYCENFARILAFFRKK